MASRTQIQMDFNHATQKANELDEIANDLSKLSGTDLQNTLNSLGNNWKGDNATLYIQKGFSLKESMDTTVTSIRQTAATIRAIAKNIYDAEMEALRIAEERAAAARRAAEAAAEAARKAAEAAAEAAKKAVTTPTVTKRSGTSGISKF